MDITKANMPPRKRACFTTLALGLEVGESSAAGAARQSGPTLEILRSSVRFEKAKTDRKTYLRSPSQHTVPEKRPNSLATHQ
ncbi:hypothetical protein Tco_0053444 [Tanacetum coccineum]